MAQDRQPDRYNPRDAEPRWQKKWDDAGIFATSNDDLAPRRRQGRAPTYYVLEMFPYPSGRIHMGHVRNYTMGDVVARYKRAQGLHRAASDGLGRLRHAGGERRHGAQGASGRLDAPEHRGDEVAAAVDGALARLGARDRDLRPVLLQAPAEDVPRLPRGRAGRAQAVEGELGPGRPDRARQRAGDRRPRLALGRAGRAARADAVVLQDQRLRGGAARRARHARALAGESAADAEELDRPLGGPAGPLRARSEDHARRARASSRFSPRAATRCSARASSRSRRIIRSRRRRRRRTRRSPTSSPSASAWAPRRR